MTEREVFPLGISIVGAYRVVTRPVLPAQALAESGCSRMKWAGYRHTETLRNTSERATVAAAGLCGTREQLVRHPPRRPPIRVRAQSKLARTIPSTARLVHRAFIHPPAGRNGHVETPFYAGWVRRAFPTNSTSAISMTPPPMIVERGTVSFTARYVHTGTSMGSTSVIIAA